MPSIKVTCPSNLQNFNVPAFSRTFCAGVYEFTEKDADLIRFFLKYPSKSIPINPQEVADVGILKPEEVAGFGYEIAIGMDEKTGKPILADPDVDKAESFVVPEGIPTDEEFGQMTIRELKDWMDDPDHSVKYERGWQKEQYVRACQRAAKKLRK